MSGLFDQITNYSPPLLTAGQVNYKGTWSAAANSPTLTSPPPATSKGDYYVVSAAGTQFGITFAVGDWIISNGTAWEKVDLTDSVSSVFGRTGAVVSANGDYTASQVTNVPAGTISSTNVQDAINELSADIATAQNVLDAIVTNAESVAITKGQVVYAFGATGNRMSVKLALNTSDATSAKTVGVVLDSSIGAGNTGNIRMVGVVDGLNLGAYNDGDTLYLGATAGSVTSTKPYAPNHLVYVGIVERANNGNGELYVKIQNGYELDEIHDVQITSAPDSGALLVRDATNSLWKAARLTAGTNIAITNADASVTVGITGTIALGNGGTGQTTAQAAINSLAGATTSGYYLRGNGTNVVMAAISAGDVPTLNQNTTGSAATLTTPRAIYGNNFDGSAALTQVIASTYGGTGNGFTKFSGPTTAEKTFTLPDSSATLLYSGGALGTPSSGTVTNLTGTASININGTVGATTANTGAFTTVNATGQITGSSNVQLFGAAGSGSANSRVINQGSDASNYGPRYELYRNASQVAIIGTYSSIVGGTSNDLTLYSNSDSIRFYSAGTNVGTFSSSGLAVTGNLLVGTTSVQAGSNVSFKGNSVRVFNGQPATVSYDLGPAGVGGDYAFLSWNNTAGSQELKLYSDAGFISFYANAAERMRINSSGNLGIGTTSPSTKLTIAQSVAATSALDTNFILLQNTSDGGSAIEFTNSVSGKARIVLGPASTGGGTDDTIIAFGTSRDASYAERARIDSYGNVGIGTTGGASRLNIAGAADDTWATSFDDGLALNGRVDLISTITTYPDTSSIRIGAGVTQKTGILITGQTTASGSTVQFRTGGSERVRIDASGNFGLNCTPRVGAWGVFSIANPSNGSSYNWGIGPDTAGALTVYTSSNVGVYLSYGATSWSAGSDERLKDIIEPITNAAAKVSSLRAVIGKYKTDVGGTRRSFLIAQDVQEVLPEAISKYTLPDNETEYLGLQYTDLIPLLVASIKELTQRVAALESN